MLTLPGRGSIAYGIQQIASQPMQFGLGPALLCRINHLGRLGEPIEPFFWLRRAPVSLREHHEKILGATVLE